MPLNVKVFAFIFFSFRPLRELNNEYDKGRSKKKN